jgi:hypothetical protein
MENEPESKGSRLERQETLWASLGRRRRQRIRRTSLRPLYQEILKSLFLTGAIIVDALLPLQVFVSFTFPVDVIASVIPLCILLYIEIRIWNAVWGKGGRWGIEKYTKGEVKT